MSLRILAVALASCLALAQTPPAPGADPNRPPPPAPQTPSPGPSKPSYHFAGKPISLEAKCGDAEISDYGMTCSAEEPCPVYLEFAAAESVGSKLFITGNLHAGTDTLWSVLLASEDDGQSWTEPFDRLRGVSLEQIQFPAFATGFIAGHTAGPLPKDPFILRTSDGGKSWSRLPLFEDGAVGLIEQIRFESATHGSINVDRGRPGVGRYATLETESGGSSWVVRQSAADPPARAARETAPLTRIVADSASKSLRIERRENGAWHTAAAFALAAGVCHAEPVPVTAEPPPAVQLH